APRHHTPRATRPPPLERRRADAAPRLQLRRRQRRARTPRRRPVLPVVPAVAAAVHRRADEPRGRRAQRIPQARGLGDLRRAAWRSHGRVRGAGPLLLTPAGRTTGPGGVSGPP